MLAPELKTKIIKEHGRAAGDTGSPEVQIALLSERINQISKHLQEFPKDKHSHRGLIKILGQRRRLTKYLNRTKS